MKGKNQHFFSFFSYRQAAIDFSKEAEIPLNKEACVLMDEKNAIREFLLSEKIEEAIEKINKIDENVKINFLILSSLRTMNSYYWS